MLQYNEMESTAERLNRDWLQVGDDRAQRELWSMSQERRDRLYSPNLIGVSGPDAEDDYENSYTDTYI
jgi:hypothetical protein